MGGIIALHSPGAPMQMCSITEVLVSCQSKWARVFSVARALRMHNNMLRTRPSACSTQQKQTLRLLL